MLDFLSSFAKRTLLCWTMLGTFSNQASFSNFMIHWLYAEFELPCLHWQPAASIDVGNLFLKNVLLLLQQSYHHKTNQIDASAPALCPLKSPENQKLFDKLINPLILKELTLSWFFYIDNSQLVLNN